MLCYGRLKRRPSLVQPIHTPTQEFIDTLFLHAFIPLISNPTHLTSYSATLLDNIFTNNLSQNVLNGIVLNYLSDHLQV